MLGVNGQKERKKTGTACIRMTKWGELLNSGQQCSLLAKRSNKIKTEDVFIDISNKEDISNCGNSHIKDLWVGSEMSQYSVLKSKRNSRL